MKLEEIVDLKSGIFPSKILWLNISFIYGGVSDLSTLNMNLDFLRNNLSKLLKFLNLPYFGKCFQHHNLV